MKYFFILLISFIQLPSLFAQSYYFPPIVGDEWETISPAELGWNEDSIDEVLSFLEAKNSKAFIVLKDGKITIEHYFGDFTAENPWYWASAGKSLVSFLVGQAQDEGLLHIDSATTNYLGNGWTSLTPEQERLVTVKHQLTMTSGFDDRTVDLNCLTPACLTYLTAPATRWAYHNAPYRLLQDVIASSSGLTIQQFTNTRLRTTIGLRGLWINYVFWSRARDMARFGLLALNKGVWNGDTLIQHVDYVSDMTKPSQTLNPSYGYLWWLNGQGSYMLPRLQLQFQTDLVPTAPTDMYAALGKNDQKIYVVPSMDLVVIRMGEDAGNSLFALSSFDAELWQKLMGIFETPTNIEEPIGHNHIRIYPNPTSRNLRFSFNGNQEILPENIRLFNQFGKKVLDMVFQQEIQLPPLANGIYTLELSYKAKASQYQRIAIYR